MRLRSLAVLLLVGTLAACSNASSPATSPAGPAASGGGPAASGGGSPATAATIQGFAFHPASLSVPVGTTVTWTNQDGVGHTVTADDGSFASGTIAGGSSFSRTFTRAGTFAYHCSIHPSMTATITVS